MLMPWKLKGLEELLGFSDRICGEDVMDPDGNPIRGVGAPRRCRDCPPPEEEPPEAPAPPDDGPELCNGKYAVGLEVRIDGLVTRTDVNGQVGTMVEYLPERGRYIVELFSGEKLPLKEKNFEAFDS